MRLFSIDVATKSLAVACVDYIGGLDSKDPNTFSSLHVVKIFTVDLFPTKNDKQLDVLERVRAVTKFAQEQLRPLITTDSTFIIEKQIKTTNTYTSYITLLSVLADQSIILVGPSFKNTLTIGGHTIGEAYQKTIHSYKANKEHTRAMFLSFKDKLTGKVEYAKKMETDIADALCQMVWVLTTNNFTL